MINCIDYKFWKKKKVFITGHTGFKGSWLCMILNLLGSEITGYSLKPKTKPNLYDLVKIKKIIKKSIISDVKDYNKLEKEIKNSNASIVFHLAAQPLVRESYSNPRETFATNFLGTLNILDIVKNIDNVETLIVITSDKVYDVSKNKVYKEQDLLLGLDPYSASKVNCEQVFYSYYKSFFFKSKKKKIATVRAGNVIGGGDFSKDRLIPDIFSSLRNKKKVIIRNPRSTRPWQHVLEPLTGYIMLAEKLTKNDKKVLSQMQNWNFGPNLNNCKTVKYITDFISKKINIEFKILNKKNNNKLETNFLRLNNTKSKKFLNWSPKWNLEKTLYRILEWYDLINKVNPRYVCEKQINDYYKI